MPNPADRDIESIPRVPGVDVDDMPDSVLKSVIRRLQAADQGGYSVSAFDNFVFGGSNDALQDAA